MKTLYESYVQNGVDSKIPDIKVEEKLSFFPEMLKTTQNILMKLWICFKSIKTNLLELYIIFLFNNRQTQKKYAGISLKISYLRHMVT